MDIIEKVTKEMIRRKLSPRTIAAYLFYIRKFLRFCRKPPMEFSKKDCRAFLYDFMKKDVSGSSLNVALNSLRFMMEEVLRKSMRLNIRYSKTPNDLPECLSRNEVKRLLENVKNPKHNLLLSLIYGAGLRVSETVKLKKCDIHLKENIGWVRKGKGNKDRPFIIPQCLKEKLRLACGSGKCYLFYGRGNHHISARTVQVVVKDAGKKAGIRKNIHPHTLRHSFATHLLEGGIDVTSVQSLLGHNEARTTLEYIHIVKPKLLSIKSPLDSL